jgi:hypothetical protein
VSLRGVSTEAMLLALSAVIRPTVVAALFANGG